ncbi:nucleoside-diphosphate-sugar epimerase family protein [Metarhizium album ARSEF 1941]|uniref:Nucleoside-diphosphate-sugar epimerase family protein n=1 Tax=Metarhizium album (strain ARSEF 1941) TaxID=1081103 RepID=A0A0B2WVB4_METAS|nr:nucleoside-diphosphate-sugar epimerase family protein [Metarhizium album ARSEF 1941]KHN98013.1 nucleoside-diphosphate-sugar epimerase family protein [Metarhizium album ARSEF 1941]
MSRALLITGATGKQGGSVIKSLLAKNPDFQILAVTRDTTSPGAKKLAAASPKITLVQGNLDDAEGIFKNATKATRVPIWGVFSVQPPAMKRSGAIIEEAQGKSLIDAAVRHGVKHFVYTSVDRHGAKSIDNPTNVPHFISKHHIEHHLIDKGKKGMSWTILRPVAFMENLAPGFIGKFFVTAWRDAIKSRPLQLISTDDIGAFAALSFMEPERFAGKSISLAGDEMTYAQLEQVFREKTGAPPPTTFGFVAWLILQLSVEMKTMFRFFETEGYGADIAAVRELDPDVKDLSRWLEGSVFVKSKRA